MSRSALQILTLSLRKVKHESVVTLCSVLSAAVLDRYDTAMSVSGRCSRFNCWVEQWVFQPSALIRALWQCPVLEKHFCCRSYWTVLRATSTSHTSRWLSQSSQPILSPLYITPMEKKKRLRSSRNLTPYLCLLEQSLLLLQIQNSKRFSQQWIKPIIYLPV